MAASKANLLRVAGDRRWHKLHEFIVGLGHCWNDTASHNIHAADSKRRKKLAGDHATQKDAIDVTPLDFKLLRGRRMLVLRYLYTAVRLGVLEVKNNKAKLADKKWRLSKRPLCRCDNGVGINDLILWLQSRKKFPISRDAVCAAVGPKVTDAAALRYANLGGPRSSKESHQETLARGRRKYVCAMLQALRLKYKHEWQFSKVGKKLFVEPRVYTHAGSKKK